MNPSQPLLNMYTTSQQSALGIVSAYLNGVQRMRQSQIEQINASAKEHAKWHKEVGGMDDYTALHTLHGEMLSQWVERCSSYWQNMFRDLTALQSDLSQALQDGGSQSAQAVREQCGQMQADLSEGAQGMLKPLLGMGTLFGAGTEAAAHVENREAMHDGMHNGPLVPHASGRGKSAAH